MSIEFRKKLLNLFTLLMKGVEVMANIEDTKKKILKHFQDNGWDIPDVASALGISEQYLRKILNNPEKHLKQVTDIIAYYKIR